jgi:Divergent InlB B-repeat domain
MKTNTTAFALCVTALFAPLCQAQFDPNRYRKDVLFGNSGVVEQPLFSGYATAWNERNARINPVGVNATGWIFGGTSIFNGDLVLRLGQTLVTDQGSLSTTFSREVFPWRSLGGVVAGPDGSAGVFVSSLAGRPSNSAITQFRYNIDEGYTGCNGSFLFTSDISSTGSGDDEVRAVTRAPNGGAYAVGTLDAGGGERRAFIARYQGNCQWDTSFNGNGVRVIDALRNLFVPARRVRFNAVRVDASGKAVAVGGVQYSTSGIADGDCVIARFTTAGALDTSFDADGLVLYRPSAQTDAIRCDATGVDFDASQRIVIQYEIESAATQPSGGNLNPGIDGLVRFNTNGSISSDFGTNSATLLPGGIIGAGVLVLDNGDIVQARNQIDNVNASPVVARTLVSAFDPNTTSGVPRWLDNAVWSNGASRMSSDLLELPGSGFLLTGFTGSTRFNHTAALLARYTFGQRYSVSVSATGAGLGVVSSSNPAGINCGNAPNGPFNCFIVVDEGATITLNAAPGSASVFTGWSLPACGTNPTCSFQVNANSSISANFALNTLTVQRVGTGGADGSVTSNIGAINCGTNCAANYNAGQVVSLTATAASGSTFVGWQDAAAACGTNPICAITMDGPRAATARFQPATQNIAVNISGDGLVVSAPSGINCPGSCNASFTNGATVTLQASVPPGSAFRFDSWGGDGAVCASNPQCAITASAPRQVTATFVRRRVTVSVTAIGGGSISTIPAGIANCIGTCAAQFDAGTTVRLVANPGAGQTLLGWTGAAQACGNNLLCDLSVLNDLSATATFGTLPNLIFANGFE